MNAAIWATAEPGTGIIAASIAILRPLFRKINSDVREKMSAYNASKSARSMNDTTKNSSQSKDDDLIALTSVSTFETSVNDVRVSKGGSIYSTASPTWDSHFDTRNGIATEVIDVKMNMAEMRPLPPLPRRPLGQGKNSSDF